jgi:hypothetical protein
LCFARWPGPGLCDGFHDRAAQQNAVAVDLVDQHGLAGDRLALGNEEIGAGDGLANAGLQVRDFVSDGGEFRTTGSNFGAEGGIAIAGRRAGSPWTATLIAAPVFSLGNIIVLRKNGREGDPLPLGFARRTRCCRALRRARIRVAATPR